MTTRISVPGEVAQRPALPSDHAFVVQFREQSRGAQLAAAGRIHHVASGEALHFESPEELLEFARRVLTRRKPHRKTRDKGEGR